jgi:hypothetical protein
MKITKSDLQKIIKAEVKKVLVNQKTVSFYGDQSKIKKAIVEPKDLKELLNYTDEHIWEIDPSASFGIFVTEMRRGIKGLITFDYKDKFTVLSIIEDLNKLQTGQEDEATLLYDRLEQYATLGIKLTNEELKFLGNKGYSPIETDFHLG